MTFVITPLFFLLALGATLQNGLPLAFARVYLPALFFFACTPPIEIAAWPDCGPPHAAIYGILAGVVMAGGLRNCAGRDVRPGEAPPLRFTPVDALAIAVPACWSISAMLSEQVYTGVSIAGERMLEWLLPYFLARLAFRSEEARGAMLRVICVSLLILLPFCLLEFRFRPYWLSRALESMHLWTGANVMAYNRFGFFRAQLTFGHPIDLGNVALLLTGIIPLLASTTRYGLRDPLVKWGLGTAVFFVVAAISFTGFLGLAVLASVWWVVTRARSSRGMLIAMVFCGMAAIAAYTAYVLGQDIGRAPDPHDILAGSLWIRKFIIQNAWRLAQSAGAFGYGKMIDANALGLSSVDNAYMLMTIMRGWVTLGAFLLIPVALASRMQRAFRAVDPSADRRQATPLAIAFATIAGVMVAMYTVWFGFVYANLFVVALAFATTLTDFYLAPRPAYAGDPETDFEEYDEAPEPADDAEPPLIYHPDLPGGPAPRPA